MAVASKQYKNKNASEIGLIIPKIIFYLPDQTKGQTVSKAIFGVVSILPKNHYPEPHLFIIVIFCLFFGRIEDTIICFRDGLTFRRILFENNNLRRLLFTEI